MNGLPVKVDWARLASETGKALLNGFALVLLLVSALLLSVGSWIKLCCINKEKSCNTEKNR